jgi:hypothetical protein
VEILNPKACLPGVADFVVIYKSIDMDSSPPGGCPGVEETSNKTVLICIACLEIRLTGFSFFLLCWIHFIHIPPMIFAIKDLI